MKPLPMTQPESMKTKSYVYGVEKLNGNDAWALFKASASGDLTKAKSLLAKDRRLVNAQFWYQFPIHMAVRGGNAQLVKLLLDHGADPGQSRFLHNSWNKLLLAAQERGFHDVESLLERTLKKKFNYSPEFAKLKNAIVARDARRAGKVLRQQRKLATAADVLGNNALHLSVMMRQLPLIERFVGLGTPIDAQRADGNTPIQLVLSRFRPLPPQKAIRERCVIIGDLLARGAEYTISIAAAVGDQERIEKLLQKDSDLAKRLDSARVSPLTYAAREGHAQIVRLLLDRGADPNIPEDLAPSGRALFEACWGNHLETARLLLDRGANPNAGMDSSGCCLTICEHFHSVKAKPLQRLLRNHGAVTPPYVMNIKQMNDAIRDGKAVIRDEEFLARVMARGNAKLLDLYLDAAPSALKDMHAYAGITYPKAPVLIRKLIDRGLDPMKRDWLGKTFLHACAENWDRSAAAVFVEAGADINARELEFKATPLAAAIRSGAPCNEEDKQADRRRRMVEFLLNHGAATSLPDDEPWATPLAWAQKRGLKDIGNVLLRHGAK